MAKIKPEKASEKIVISKFGGLRQTSALTGANASTMRNFRISADGSLEKRTGTKTLYDLGTAIRGLWQGSLESRDYLVVIAGAYTYVKLPGGSTLSRRTRLSTNSGAVSFVVFNGHLYLLDGNNVYRFSTSTNVFSATYGYAPLYGNEWSPLQMGEICEPINALSQKIRINYNNRVGSTVFELPFGAISLDRVEVDGEEITPNPYVTGATSFSIPPAYAYGSLTVALTLAANYSYRSSIAALSKSFLFTGADRNTLLLYGGTQTQQIAYSAPVTDEMMTESNRIFSADEDPLYFPLENFFSLADAAHPIHALFRDRDRAIALNDRAAWALEFSGSRLISYPLEGGVGCSSPGGFTLCGDHPVTIQAGGVFRLRFPSGESDVCIPEALSQDVIELLPVSLFQNGILAWFPGRDELWLRDPTETEEGLVWVCKTQSKEWYCFDNLPISNFFELNGTVGFGTDDGRILAPDETSYTDSGTAFTAYYHSHFLAFSSPENCKRAIRTTVCADTGGQRLILITETDSRSRPYSVVNEQSGRPLFFDYSMNMGRFRFLRFLFSITGNAPARIYRLSMLANP